MSAYAYVILAVGWLTWVTPFFLTKGTSGKPQTLDRRARWGIALQGVAYALLWQHNFWERSPDAWRVALSVFFLALASLLSWSSARAWAPVAIRCRPQRGPRARKVRGLSRGSAPDLHIHVVSAARHRFHDHAPPPAAVLDRGVHHRYGDPRPDRRYVAR